MTGLFTGGALSFSAGANLSYPIFRAGAGRAGVRLTEADAACLARLVPAAPAVASTALRATRLVDGDASTARLIVEGMRIGMTSSGSQPVRNGGW